MSMKRIRLWSIARDEHGQDVVRSVSDLENTETEQRLEDLLVANPDLLFPGGAIVGRQIPTGGGPLDLVGIDQDGALVVFELKRGTLTREAVAQVLDYASYLAELSADEVSRLIETNSGRSGVEAISDFADWYAREYPDAELMAEPPRMVLVGLGVDERARRIVNHLAVAGVDIQLLTFHAFAVDGQLLLARQVESDVVSQKRDRTTSATKETSLRVLLETAEKQRVRELLQEVEAYLSALLPGYVWPGKTAYSFSLQERTDEGRPTLRSYATVYLHHKESGKLLLTFADRAIEVARASVERLVADLPEARMPAVAAPWLTMEVEISRANWQKVRERLDQLVPEIVAGWRRKLDEQNRTDVTASEEPAT
jgi:hypothetical protein